MAIRTRFEGSDDIGVFAKITNTYCLVSDAGSTGSVWSFAQTFRNELADSKVPVIQTSLANCRIIGRLCAGNSKGLLLPSTATGKEVVELQSQLPEGVVVKVVEEPLSALGNVVAVNDHVALVHPSLDKATQEAIRDTLGVEVFPLTVAGNELVGSYCAFSNHGCLVHPRATAEEMDELSNVLSMPVYPGTVNRGSDLVGAGLVVNDFVAFCGLNTTATEIAIIEKTFNLRKAQPPHQGEAMTSSILGSLR